MKRYANKKTAKIVMLVGGVVFAVSVAINLTTAFSVYGKIDECLDQSPSCTLGAEQVAGKLAMILGYVGVGMFLTGLALLIIESSKKKHQ